MVATEGGGGMYYFSSNVKKYSYTFDSQIEAEKEFEKLNKMIELK